MINKEYGSDFHYYLEGDVVLRNPMDSLFYGSEFSLFFSGRTALFNIINEGIKFKKWAKIFLPSYYCHEVTHFIKRLPIEIIYYEFNPFLDSELNALKIEDIEKNVIVNVDFFGLKKADCSIFKNVVIIEDITHNILGFQKSQADYCFGSLRKELPVPAGGFCFSPKNFPLPTGTSNLKSENVAEQKLSAMFLKEKYLNGKLANKESFRKLFSDAENDFENDFTNTSISDCAKAILFQIDIKKILLHKYANIKTALIELENINNLKINFESNKKEAFGLSLECKTQIDRDKLKDHLIFNNIYPAVLWPNQLKERDEVIKNRTLFLHLDYRYDSKDIKVITNTIKDFFNYE
jgi:hypothetical protein